MSGFGLHCISSAYKGLAPRTQYLFMKKLKEMTEMQELSGRATGPPLGTSATEEIRSVNL